MTLYELNDQYMQLLAMLEDPDCDPEILADTFEGLEGEIADKLDSYEIIIKELEADREKIGKEIDRLDKIDLHLSRNIDRMKSAIMLTMQVTGCRKLPTEHFQFSIVKNGGKQGMEVDDLENIPKEYIKMVPKPDSEKIREVLESGETLTFARLKERGKQLRVK